MSSLKKHLESAQEIGQDFRSTLRRSATFNRTKWFDTLASRIKPAILAVVVAAGATGCSTMANQAMDDAAFPGGYQNVVTETAQLNTLPPEQLQQAINERRQSNEYADLERISIPDLAQRLVDARMDTTQVLEKPMVIESPFQPGKLVRISNNQDLSANWDLMVKHGMGGITDVVSIRKFDSPFAYNSNHASKEAKSFQADSSPSFIILPKRMTTSNWALHKESKKVEAVADILFHELGHTTMVQEMNLYGGDDPRNQSSVEANGNTYRVLNENHSDIAAPIASYKAYDLTPEDFIERLEYQIAMEKLSLKRVGLHGAPKAKQMSLTDYRPGKGLEVLIEITKQNPEFLKNLPYDAIPVFANDIAKKAGYFHNSAEIIAETSMQNLYPTMGEPLADTRDTELMTDIWHYLPNNDLTQTVRSAAEELEKTWAVHDAQRYMEHLHGALTGFAVFDDYKISPRVLDESAHPISQLKVEPDVQANLKDLVTQIRESSNQGQGMTPELAAAIQENLRETSASLPSRDELSQKRADLINIIQEEIETIKVKAGENDPTFRLAQGSGLSAENISVNMQATYGDTAWFEGGSPQNQMQVAKQPVPSPEIKNSINDSIAAKYTDESYDEPGHAPGM